MYSGKRRCKMYQQAIYIDPQASPRRAGRYVISIPLFASLLFFASLANAQQFVEIQRASRDASGRKTPVIADITLQTTWITPWGTYTQSLKGKYWRSRDGKNRAPCSPKKVSRGVDREQGNVQSLADDYRPALIHERRAAPARAGPDGHTRRSPGDRWRGSGCRRAGAAWRHPARRVS